MFLKYPKTFRIIVPQINVRGKHFLSGAETKKLLAGKVSITEKIDGANIGIIRHRDTFHLQKRGSLIGQSEHPQYGFFVAWAQTNREKLLQIPKDTILYGELCVATHTIPYNTLPDWVLAFAWYDKKNDTYFSRDEMTVMCDRAGLSYTPELFRGHIEKNDLFDLIPDKSHFGNQKAEGIVVEKTKDHMRGKVVREEFVKNMEKDLHWSKKNIKYNKLRKRQ